jgi:hypothetical protein
MQRSGREFSPAEPREVGVLSVGPSARLRHATLGRRIAFPPRSINHLAFSAAPFLTVWPYFAKLVLYVCFSRCLLVLEPIEHYV